MIHAFKEQVYLVGRKIFWSIDRLLFPNAQGLAAVPIPSSAYTTYLLSCIRHEGYLGFAPCDDVIHRMFPRDTRFMNGCPPHSPVFNRAMGDSH